MTLRRCFLLIALLGGTQMALAEPCVGFAFETPVEGAVNVTTHVADVPSSRFPGLWQEGVLDGYFYALFANGEATVKSARGARDWGLKVTCETGVATCKIRESGTPPQDAADVAARLAQCLKGRASEPPEAPKPPKAPCGLQTVAEGPEAQVLQNLLVAAGQDLGAVDGIWGAKSLSALVSVLGEEAATFSIAQAITAVDAYLCKPSD